MVSALCLAAKSGVDVRIITPHIYDKALIHLTTRSFYRELIYGGVKIYEYSKDHLLFDTMHAVSMTTDEGVELLVPIGLETVTLKGKHFTAHKATGDTVHQVSIS